MAAAAWTACTKTGCPGVRALNARTKLKGLQRELGAFFYACKTMLVEVSFRNFVMDVSQQGSVIERTQIKQRLRSGH
jgi:hypothetical protein